LWLRRRTTAQVYKGGIPEGRNISSNLGLSAFLTSVLIEGFAI